MALKILFAKIAYNKIKINNKLIIHSLNNFKIIINKLIFKMKQNFKQIS